MQCKQCNSINKDGAKFCNECGTVLEQPPQTIHCKKCDAKNENGLKFCTNCGNSLLAETPKEKQQSATKEVQTPIESRSVTTQKNKSPAMALGATLIIGIGLCAYALPKMIGESDEENKAETVNTTAVSTEKENVTTETKDAQIAKTTVNPNLFIGQTLGDAMKEYGSTYEVFLLANVVGGAMVKFPTFDDYFSIDTFEFINYVESDDITAEASAVILGIVAADGLEEAKAHYVALREEKQAQETQDLLQSILNPTEKENTTSSQPVHSVKWEYNSNMTLVDYFRQGDNYKGVKGIFYRLQITDIIRDKVYLAKGSSYSDGQKVIVDDSGSNNLNGVIGDFICVYGTYEGNDFISYTDGASEQVPVVRADHIAFVNYNPQFEDLAEALPIGIYHLDMRFGAETGYNARYLGGNSVELIVGVAINRYGTVKLQVLDFDSMESRPIGIISPNLIPFVDGYNVTLDFGDKDNLKQKLEASGLEVPVSKNEEVNLDWVTVVAEVDLVSWKRSQFGNQAIDVELYVKEIRSLR